jgi:hypothetical protein
VHVLGRTKGTDVIACRHCSALCSLCARWQSRACLGFGSVETRTLLAADCGNLHWRHCGQMARYAHCTAKEAAYFLQARVGAVHVILLPSSLGVLRLQTC